MISKSRHTNPTHLTPSPNKDIIPFHTKKNLLKVTMRIKIIIQTPKQTLLLP